MGVERGPVSFLVLPAGSYVASIDGGDPLIRWQLETGLDWTISSVAGESYRVDVSRPLLAPLFFPLCPLELLMEELCRSCSG